MPKDLTRKTKSERQGAQTLRTCALQLAGLRAEYIESVRRSQRVQQDAIARLLAAEKDYFESHSQFETLRLELDDSEIQETGGEPAISESQLRDRRRQVLVAKAREAQARNRFLQVRAETRAQIDSARLNEETTRKVLDTIERAAKQSEAPKAHRGRPTEKTKLRAEMFKRIKLEHPEWSQHLVALKAGPELGEIVTGESVRNAFRAIGWEWERGDRTNYKL